ncbi:ATP-dependent DNA helicase RecG [Nocardioides sp.]|uniref:ATP-dependent DNA helicase RecG n=1 Tax=Nocardioides sp. TaxID=35761 RepID=UPI002B2675B2|nr:ATP-dependent DNA helicase RecG [Nocardioides sp.]
MITVDSPVTTVLGQSKTADKIINKLHISTVGDLLRHFPRRYLETGKLTKVDDLAVGQMLTVIGEIAHSKQHTYTDRRNGLLAYRLETTLRTDGPSLRMTFFAKKKHTAEWQEKKLPVGARGLFLGKAETFNNEWKLSNPRMVLFAADDGRKDPYSDIATVEAIGKYFPIYPLTAKVESWDLQRAITFTRSVVDDLPELIPEPIRREFDLLDVTRAYDLIHAPDQPGDVHDAQRYFRFEEALVTQLVLGRRRRAVQALGAVARTGGDGALLEAFDARLPFELTEGQRSIGADLDADLARPHPMNRLLQGEVGSGKTLVALRAMLRVVDSGGQAALLAPTEVLAQQHHRAISALMGDLAAGGMLGGAAEGTGVELLTGSMTKTQRTAPLSRLASGESGLVVGTHALLEDQVQFADLGLVVVDEQHRFGVEQRAALTSKAAGSPPHVLVMTATPIPRTVAMTVFGDLETSTLTELPAGRAPITTAVVNLLDHPGWITRVWERVREEVEKGHQAYVVCPRISGDELEQGQRDQVELDDDGEPVAVDRTAAAPSLAAVEDGVVALAEGPLAGLRLAALHGRLGADEKDSTMRAFAAGEIDVLVSTTVIEVGVDVANATIMVLLDADRFGVSQLHQLRGRVGRGGLPGQCLLVSSVDLESPARDRLDAVARTTDGFELSRVDLATRREGDVLGSSQAGRRSGLRHLEVLRDETTILEARSAAEALLDTDPDLAGSALLAEAVSTLETDTRGDFIEKS